MKTFDYTDSYGNEYKLAFEKVRYVYGGLAIEVHCQEDDSDWWEPYATLTKNVGDFPPTSWAYLDANNLPDLVKFVLDKGWCEKVGEARSGFCIYPLVEFTDEFLDEICVTEEEA